MASCSPSSEIRVLCDCSQVCSQDLIEWASLLSVSQLMRSGCKVVFEKDACEIYSAGRLVARAGRLLWATWMRIPMAIREIVQPD